MDRDQANAAIVEKQQRRDALEREAKELEAKAREKRREHEMVKDDLNQFQKSMSQAFAADGAQQARAAAEAALKNVLDSGRAIERLEKLATETSEKIEKASKAIDERLAEIQTALAALEESKSQFEVQIEAAAKVTAEAQKVYDILDQRRREMDAQNSDGETPAEL